MKLLEAKELLDSAVAKARQDSDYKEQLMGDPLHALEQLSGQELALEENVQIVVEDQTDPNKVYLNIPRNVSTENLELTDEELELVAGGELGVAATVISIVAIGIGAYYCGRADREN